VWGDNGGGDMKFEIRRTSNYGDGEKPYDGANQERVANYDQRTFKSFEEHDSKLKQSWLSRGTEHAVNEKGIVRRIEDVLAWTIEINSLDELMELYKKEGSLIIQKSWNNNGMNCIEIYDGYRE
jgi:hypothetical protein